MCQTEVIYPLLPNMEDSLSECEDKGEIVFCIKESGLQITAKRNILADANPVFKRMFEGPLGCEPKVIVPDVDPQGFNNLIKYLNKEPLHLSSVSIALRTLYAAHKYQCNPLEVFCLSHISCQIDNTCVLDVFSDIHNYCNVLGRVNGSDPFEPSAPPMESIDYDTMSSSSAQGQFLETIGCYNTLLDICLDFIDAHADIILSNEQIEELSMEEMLLIANRDSLQISSELILFTALEKWAKYQCRLTGVTVSAENMKSILGTQLLFSVRYPYMTSEEFLLGPMKAELLNQHESRVMLGYILNHPVKEKPDKYLEMLLPTLLTNRQKSKKVDRHDSQSNSWWCSRIFKKRSKDKKRCKQEEESFCSKCGYYFFFCLSHVFD